MARSTRLWAGTVAALATGTLLAGCGGESSASPHGPSHPPGSDRVVVDRLVPPDSKWPASGACEQPDGDIAVVETNPDAPAPRCVAVHSTQRLKVVNTSDRFGFPGRTVKITFGDFPARSVKVGASTIFDKDFGAYLMTGDHLLHISLYGGGSGEVFMCPDHVTGPYRRLCA